MLVCNCIFAFVWLLACRLARYFIFVHVLVMTPVHSSFVDRQADDQELIEKKKKRTFPTYTNRGVDLEQLLDMTRSEK